MRTMAFLFALSVSLPAQAGESMWGAWSSPWRPLSNSDQTYLNNQALNELQLEQSSEGGGGSGDTSIVYKGDVTYNYYGDVTNNDSGATNVGNMNAVTVDGSYVTVTTDQDAHHLDQDADADADVHVHKKSKTYKAADMIQ